MSSCSSGLHCSSLTRFSALAAKPCLGWIGLPARASQPLVSRIRTFPTSRTLSINVYSWHQSGISPSRLYARQVSFDLGGFYPSRHLPLAAASVLLASCCRTVRACPTSSPVHGLYLDDRPVRKQSRPGPEVDRRDASRGTFRTRPRPRPWRLSLGPRGWHPLMPDAQTRWWSWRRLCGSHSRLIGVWRDGGRRWIRGGV
jgi:hypothetical protein